MKWPGRNPVLWMLCLGLPILASCGLRSNAGGPAPEFQMEAVDGVEYSLDDCRGKVCLISLWATWCPSCMEEIPALNALSQDFGESLLILGVTVDEDEKVLSDFLGTTRMEYPVIRAEESFLRDLSFSGLLPTLILIGPDGRIRSRYVGPRTEEFLRGEIRRVLGQAQARMASSNGELS